MIDPLVQLPRDAVTFKKGDKVILCEGRDECYVLTHLTTNWVTKPKVGTKGDAHGWDGELRQLASQVAIRGVAAIGLVFDAEDSRVKREKWLRKIYAHAGLRKPARPNQLKWSPIDGVRVRTAYLINPSRRPSGSLDTLFLGQIRGSDVGKCVTALMHCYAECCPSKQKNLEKLEVRSFIAHANATNTGLGLAVRDKHLNCDGREFDTLKRFAALLESA